MKIKTVQWNIGGGKIRDNSEDSLDTNLYKNDGLDYIIETLRKFNPDIVTLQETHAKDSYIQAQEIAKKLGLDYYFNDVYDKSHLEDGMGLGQAILSRFPLGNHKFTFFYNPKFEKTQDDGSVWISHDKGVTSVEATIDNSKLDIRTLHLIPFRKFDIDLEDPRVAEVKESIVKNLESDSDRYLLQGDFNVDDPSLSQFLPSFIEQVKEVLLDSATTPKGRKYDHVVYKGLKHIKSDVLSDALTDHYPVINEFEL